MAKVFQRSYKFLPEVFQTAINRKFLNNTFDNLVTPGTTHQLNNYIGRRQSRGSRSTDNWLAEPNHTLRTAYQVEVGAASQEEDGTYSFGASFEDLVLALQHYGANTSELSKLLKDDFKPADFKIDLDKLVNFRQYYWLPQGPDAVPISFGEKNYDAIKANSFSSRVLVYFDNNDFYIRTSSIPDHVVDQFPNALSTRELSSKTLTFKFAKSPGSAQIQNQVVVDPGSMIGVAKNGLPFYTYTMGTKETLGATEYTVNTPFFETQVLAFDDYGFDVVGMDGEGSQTEDLQHRSPTAFRGHPDANGVYHYHTYTSVFYSETPTSHSPILGFAFDGFPIYGPYAWSNQDGTGEITRMVSSYKLRDKDANAEPARGTPDGRYVEDFAYVDGLGDLDENNGRFCVTPEFPKGTYAYFLTIDEVGTPAFPYVVGPRYHGSPIKQSGTIGVPNTLEVYTRIANYGVNIERDIIGKTQFSIDDIKFTNGLKVAFGLDALPKEYANREFYVEGVGTSIELVPTTDLKLPELYIGTITDKYDRSDYDRTTYEEVAANPITPDYIIVKRNDQSRNAWTRINRWFHLDVIEDTAKYLKKSVLVDNTSQAQRPIIEFDANIALYNHAYKNVAFVDVFDTTITDALSNIQGSPGYALDGVTFINGTKVVFANDSDPDVRNKIYEVEILYLDEGRATSEFVEVDADADEVTVTGDFNNRTIAVKQDERVLRVGTDYTISNITETTGTINLVTPLPIITNIEVVFMDLQPNIQLKEYASAEEFDGILVVSGNTKIGDAYYYRNTNWILGQNKANLNVEPLFNLYDSNNESIGNRTVYQGSTFTGNKLFTYARGTGTNDTVLGFPLSYSSISNVSDIQFDWNHSKDSFNYVVSGVSQELSTENFYAYDHKKQVQRSVVLSTQRDQSLPVIDVRFIDEDTNLLALKSKFYHSDYQQTIFVYVDDALKIRGNDYDLKEIKVDGVVVEEQIAFRTTVPAGSKVVIKYLPAESITTQSLIWEVPLSLSVNPYNEQITTVDLGSIVRHYQSGVANTLDFKGFANGRNNSRDVGVIPSLSQSIGYNNGNLLLATALLKNQDFGFIESIEYSRDEYTKFKNNLISIYESGLITYDIEKGTSDLVDKILQDWALGKTPTFPYADSDMLPSFTNFVETSYQVKYQQDKTYPLSEVFVDEEESRKAVLVYLNGTLLTRGKDYEFSTTLPTVVLDPAVTLEEYDTVIIREYDTTGNNFVPPTPAKLGLAEVYEPGFVTISLPKADTVRSVRMIRGHDGSLTPAWPGDDDRNNILLDVETRIYNNIKKYHSLASSKLRRKFNPLPGAFRNTLNDLVNGNEIINRSFGQWILKGSLDYTANDSFTRSDQWTWNYRGQRDRWNNIIPVGHWQGLYDYFFDCQSPNTQPWEMLGFHEEPTWWESEYGPAPYTRKNTKLWTDLELGLIRQGEFAGIDGRYVRKDLQLCIPVDDHGNLLDPLSSGLLINASGDSIAEPWQFGDGAPVEAAWRRSSESKFAFQEYAAITSPRQYFGIGFDLLDLAEDPVDGLVKIVNTTSKVNHPVRQDTVAASIATATQANGYLAWLEGRSKLLNISTADFATFIKNIEPRLLYKLSGFSDKDKLRFYINAVTPGSTNSLSLLPEDSYQLLLDKSAPIDRLVYSGVIITKVIDGWKVEGYDTQNANFYILPSISPGPNHTIRVGGKPESFVKWEPSKNYVRTQVVKIDNTYYRVLKDHVSTEDEGVGTLIAPLSGLPEIGGVTGIVWETFDTTPVRVSYGTRYATLQEVFDFIIGYGRYLESRGFIFSEYNSELGEILNWELSGKELLYWSTQNWNIGAVLTLSPASTGVTIYIPQGEIDSLYAPSSDPKSVLNQSREPLTASDLDVDRNFDVVTIVPTYPEEKSIYFLSANIRNFDHLVVFDNRTTFNDVVYEPVTGARQERLQIKGYKSNSWNGKFFIPGFTLDQNKISEWTSYTDYKLGDLVKLGDTVFQCVENHQSDVLFDYAKFSTLVKQPKLYLQPNLETLAEQMDQYYGLNSEQIASDASNYARHLIGFQKRSYLEDLLANDETQFKFYQGMITQKGTEAAVSKLLRAAAEEGTDVPSVDIKDEWALRIGEFGLSDNVDEIEVRLASKDFYFDKTLIDFTGSTFADRDLVGINSDNIITTSERSIDELFPVTPASYLQKTAGYARIDQVDATFLTNTELTTYSSTVTEADGSILWVASHVDDMLPRMYRTKKSMPCKFTILDGDVVSIDIDVPVVADELCWIYPNYITPTGETFDATTSMIGPFTIDTVSTADKTFTVINGTGLAKDDVFTGFFVQLEDVKLPTFTPSGTGDRLYDTEIGERLWIDSYNGGWAVLKHTEAYSDSTNLDVSGNLTEEIGTAVHAWNYFTAPWFAAQINVTPESGYTDQAVAVWERLNDDDVLTQISEPLRGETTSIDADSNFGAAIHHADRDTLFIGAPANDSDTGAVLIYVRNQDYGVWELVDTDYGDNAGDLLGSSIAYISDTRMLVGAPGAGKVYQYTYDGATWSRNSYENGGTGYGTSIKISDTLMAIGDTDGNKNVHLYSINLSTSAKTFITTVAGTSLLPATSFDIWKQDNTKYLAVGSDTVSTDGSVAVYTVGTASVTLAQTLTPYNIEGARQFGFAVKFTDSGKLLVGDPNAPANRSTTFSSTSGDLLTFDGGVTTFSEAVTIGKLIVFGNYLGNWMYEQEIENPLAVDKATGSLFGSIMTEKSGQLFVAQPGLTESGDPTVSATRDIRVWEEQGLGWITDSLQEPVVDMSKVNRSLNYDPAKGELINFLQMYDPLSNNHDSTALVNIDYTIAIDPAIYQADSPGSTYWGEEAVGRVWWDVKNAYWLDYQQGDDLSYRLKHWGQLYPNASIDVYEWVESRVVPALYNVNNQFPDMGQPANNAATQPYNAKVIVGSDGLSYNLYYFWVKNKQYTESLGGKTMPVGEIARLLEYGPDKYVAISGVNNVITYNLDDDFVQGQQVLQVELLRSTKENPQHVEWALLNEGDTVAPPATLEAKMIDSLTGLDTAGNIVPDPKLSAFKKIGTKFRPRQTMFVDRISAIETSVEFINDRLAESILVDTNLGSLTDSDPIPEQTEIKTATFDFGNTTFDETVTIFEESLVNWNESFLTYADIIEDELPNKPEGYKILVEQDENFFNYWTIYTWTGSALELTQIQRYDVNRYWTRVDYYDGVNYTSSSIPDATVATEQEFINNNYPVGTIVKVLGTDGWRVLMQDANRESTIVAMQNGTIRVTLEKADFDKTLSFDSVGYDGSLFDEQPSIELRKVLQAMRDNIFINEKRSIWNRWFFRMVRYALVEQIYLDWAIKSSFIKVVNTIGSLTERSIYALTTDDSLEKYINEIKPYHTKIREYTGVYTRVDPYESQATDFDCPPHYEEAGLKRSVIYQPDQEDLFTNYMPWRSFADYHRQQVVAIVVTDGGYGYNSPPTITLRGGHDANSVELNRPATADSTIGTGKQSYTTLTNGYFDFRKVWRDKQADADNTIDSNDVLVDMIGPGPYAVTRITVIDSGEGYITPPEVIIEGGGGTGAKAYAVLGDTKQRMFRVGMKFDRIKGSADILPKELKDYSNVIPDFNEWHAADRIYAHYTPSERSFGIPAEDTITHTGDGTTVEFACPYETNYAEQIRVSVDSEIVTNYTVHESSKTVEFDTAPDADAEIIIAIVPALLPLLRGAGFDKTKIVGTAFNSGPGFDSQTKGFDSVQFDNWDLDPNGQYVEQGGFDTYLGGGRFDSSLGIDPTEIIRVFTGDGVTTALDLKFVPNDVDSLWVQVNKETKIVGTDFTVTENVLTFDTAPSDGDIITIAKVIKVAVGDGTNTEYTLTEAIGSARTLSILVGEDYLTPVVDFTVDTDTITLTTAPAVGSIVIIENVLSSIANGSDFLNPDTIPSTEECLSGQVFDTVDIKVYSQPIAGATAIGIASWTADGVTNSFALSELPITQQGITVFVNGLAQDPGLVTVEYTTSQLVFNFAPDAGDIVTAVIVKDQGIAVHQVQNFIGDGTTNAFRLVNADLTSPNANTNRSTIFIVNGVKQEHVVTQPTNSGDLLFTVATAPADGARIKVIVYESSQSGSSFDIDTYDATTYDPQIPGGKRYSETFNEVITLDPAIGAYNVNNAAGALAPFTASAICHIVAGPARVGERLRPADTAYYIADGTADTFDLPTNPEEDYSSYVSTDLNVTVDGLDVDVTGFTFDPVAKTFTLAQIPATDSLVTVTTFPSGDYYVRNSSLFFNSTVNFNGTRVLVTTLNDSSVVGLRTEVFTGGEVITLSYGFGTGGFSVSGWGTTTTYEFDTGTIVLSKPIINVNQAQVYLNGVYKKPSSEWKLKPGTLDTVVIEGGVTDSDIVVIHYTTGGRARSATGFRIFKDMIGRVNYYRINEENSTRLTEDLAIDDTKIYVYDVSALPAPEREKNKPGVVMINKERIEYWTKGDGYITDFRRGTLGTGVAPLHERGALVVDMDQRNAVPSSELIHKTSEIGNGTKVEFDLPVVLTTMDEEAVAVFVGGRRSTDWTHNGTKLTFNSAPRAGLAVHIVIKQAKTWYDLDNPTASLQTLDTAQARFIRDKAAVFDL